MNIQNTPEELEALRNELALEPKTEFRDKNPIAPPTAPLETRMREYAARYLKRHPKTKSDKLARIVAKKFNVKFS